MRSVGLFLYLGLAVPLAGVSTGWPAPMQPLCAGTGTLACARVCRMPQARVAFRSCTLPGCAPDTHTGRLSSVATTSKVQSRGSGVCRSGRAGRPPDPSERACSPVLAPAPHASVRSAAPAPA